MTMTIADRRTIPEAARLPKQLAFKTAADTAEMAGQMVSIDETEGIVTAIVSVTGVVDEVADIIVPGAYRETLTKRRPKVCWAHSWEHPIGKVLYIEELLPGDDRLPSKTRDGKAWPKEAGALVATMQFNLRTDEGKNAFEVVRFYSETGECEYSIGYNVPPGRAATDGKGIRHIKMLELYELSVVLFGAHTMTGTLSIKDAVRAITEVKRITSVGGVDLAALSSKGSVRAPVVSRRAGTGEGKAPVPPQFRKAEEEEPAEGGKPTPVKPTVTEKPDLEGQHDADTNLTATCPGCEEMVVFDTANGWQRLDGSYSHDDGTTHSDWLLPPDDAAEQPEGAEAEAEGEPGPDERPPVTDQAGAGAAVAAAAPLGEGEEDDDAAPDFSDGIMVAVYPDPAAADAVAAHIAGPDATTPREELHVTLAYLGKIGESQMTEQQIIDAVTRAVEGQPALEGEIGGIGQFPAGDDGAPTYAPVDVPGLSLLREQVVSELGDAVYTDHGFTPHMTLGYNIGIIDPVPATPVRFTEVRVVYGNSQRAITLGAPVAEQKSRTFFTEQEPPAVEAKAGDLWFRTDDATMHECVGEHEWKAVDPMTAPVAKVSDDSTTGYDPSLDVKAGQPRILPGLSAALAAAMEGKAGGSDRNRGEAEELREYWTTGEGGALIGWGTDGDFSRCVVALSEHMTPDRAKGYCANRHKEMTGMWPGDRDNTKDANVSTDTKAGDAIAAPAGKSYPQMPGSYEERQQAIRDGLYAQYADEVDEHGHPQVWVDLRATWPDRVLYSVDRYNAVGGDTDHFIADYRLTADGGVEFGRRDEVELTIVPVVADGADGDEVPLGDALPLVEDVMGVVTAFKTAQRAMEGKAGRVLSGANERSLRTAVEHLINVLAAAGIDLGEVTPENPRPTGNTGSDGDVRREIDPAVDLETTSPSAATKGAPSDTEAKGLASGEVPMIDMTAHTALLAAIEQETAEI